MIDDPNSDEGAGPAEDHTPHHPAPPTIEDLAKGKNDVSGDDMSGAGIE